MVNGLYYAHTGTRWLVVLAIAVALGFMIYSLVSNREQDRFTRMIMLAFSSLVGLQWVIGIVYYLIYGNAIDNYTRPGWVEHLTTMTLALVVAHLYIPFRKRADTRTYYIASTAVILVTTALIVYGVSVLMGTTASRWSFAPVYVPGL